MRNVSIFTLFYKSLYSFKDIAKFRFLGIGKTIQYVFILVVFYFLPALVQTLIIDRNYSTLLPVFNDGSIAIMLPIYIVSMYILNIGIIFLKISIFAGLAALLANLIKRKLPYRQSWRLTAFSITLPTVLFGLEPLTHVEIPFGLLIDFLISLIYIYGSINKMPLAKKQ